MKKLYPNGYCTSEGTYTFYGCKSFIGSTNNSVITGSGTMEWSDGTSIVGTWENNILKSIDQLNYVNRDYKNVFYGIPIDIAIPIGSKGSYIFDKMGKAIKNNKRLYSSENSRRYSRIKYSTNESMTDESMTDESMTESMAEEPMTESMAEEPMTEEPYPKRLLISNASYTAFGILGDHHQYKCNIIFKNKITVTGQFNKDLSQGTGRITLPTNEVYEGEICQFRRCGYGTQYFNNKVYYRGEFKDDKYNGVGQRYNNDMLQYSGDFKENIIEGFGVLYTNRRKVYEGEFKNNHIDHFGAFFDENQHLLYEGHHINGVWNGQGQQYFANGYSFIGNFENNVLNGVVSVCYHGVIIHQGSCVHGVFTDSMKIWNPQTTYYPIFKTILMTIEYADSYSCLFSFRDLHSVKETTPLLCC